MGSHIFQIWGIRKFRQVAIYIGEDFHYINQCVNSFQEDLVKRLYNSL